jgi:3',5'-cyclic-AMP phosphodiesterase
LSLPPISRREFLKRSASAAALVASGGCAHLRPLERQSVALFSDTHIAADPTAVERGVNMTENLRRVVREVLEWPARPAQVLISGDLAFNNGEVGDYRALAETVTPLRHERMPIHLAVGNHDNREHFWTAEPAARAMQGRLASRQVSIIRGAVADWFMLDSLIRTRETPGLLGDAQRAWLAAALDANLRKPAIVVVHHNPPQAGGPEKNALEDAEQLLSILRPRRQVKAWIFGHTHHWRVWQDDSGLHLINLPPTAYVFEPGQPSGWVHARIDPAGMTLQLRCLDRTHPEHGRISELRWRV